MPQPPTILGIDPGTRFMGVAVLRGRELLDYGVHQLWNGTKPYDLIGQARRIVLSCIERFAPQIVAIEKPYRISEPRAAVLFTLVSEVKERAKELGVEVQEVTPEEVRRAITGNPSATKYEVAQRLVASGFSELRHLVPKKPEVPALWLSAKERYWLHMFDALGLAVATAQE